MQEHFERILDVTLMKDKFDRLLSDIDAALADDPLDAYEDEIKKLDDRKIEIMRGTDNRICGARCGGVTYKLVRDKNGHPSSLEKQ